MEEEMMMEEITGEEMMEEEMMEEEMMMEEEEVKPVKPAVTKPVAKPVTNTVAKPAVATTKQATKPATPAKPSAVKIAAERKIVPKAISNTTTATKATASIAVVKGYEEKKAVLLEKFISGTGGMPLVPSTIDDLIFSKQHEAGFGMTKDQTSRFMSLVRDVFSDIIDVGGSFKLVDNDNMSLIIRSKVLSEDTITTASALPALVNQGVTHILKYAGHISVTCKFSNKAETTANGYINDQDEFVIISNE